MREFKTGRLAISLIFIFFVTGSGLCSGIDSESLTPLQAGLYINEKSLSRSADGKVSLWIKIIPEEDSTLMYEARDHLLQDNKEYQALNYEYTGLLSEIDCFGKRHRELMTIMYDVNKNIVDSVETASASWEDITAASSLALVLAAVCN